MPTGYTSKIEEGISFKEFALDCARAFGACVTLRDEPMGGDRIPEEFKVSSYYLDLANDKELELKRLEALTPDQIQNEFDYTYTESMERFEKSVKKQNALKTNYENMLESVKNWTPPSPNHVKLKEFMENQIIESIRFDCDYEYPVPAIVQMNPRGWHEKRIKECKREIERAKEEYKKEIERVNSRNQWIRLLRESL